MNFYLCQPCLEHIQADPKTGCCLFGQCERCGTVTDVAIVTLKNPRQPLLPLEVRQECA